MGLEGGIQALVNMSGAISETGGGSTVEYESDLTSGVKIGTLTIDNMDYDLYAPGSGDIVTFTQILESGTKIGTITIDNVSTDIYAPEGGGSDVSFTQVQNTGTKIGTITIDDVSIDIYAPTPDIVSYASNISDIGKEKIGTIKINNVDNDVYIREVTITTTWTSNLDGYYLNISVGDSSYQNYVPNNVNGLSDVNISSPSNGQVLSYDSTSSKWINTTPSSGGGGINYSETEQDTGIKWIDGKTIYQKTIDFGALPNSTTKNVAHNISNIDQIVKIEGFANIGSGTKFTALSSSSTNASYQAALTADKTNVIIETASNRSTWYGYVTLYYTKSTT